MSQPVVSKFLRPPCPVGFSFRPCRYITEGWRVVLQLDQNSATQELPREVQKTRVVEQDQELEQLSSSHLHHGTISHRLDSQYGCHTARAALYTGRLGGSVGTNPVLFCPLGILT